MTPRSHLTRLLAPPLLALALLCALAGAAPAANLPSGFREDAFLTDLVEPTSVAFAPKGRVFVAEKAGRIVVYDGIGDGTKTVIADLAKQVYDSGDRGLLSIALDPEFPTRPYVYALYTFDHVIGEDAPGAYPRWGQGPEYVGDPCPIPPGSTADACPVSGRLVRLTVTGGGAGNGVVESGGSPQEHVLIGEDWCQQFSSHSIGDLAFGPEGDLYVSGGDGASFNVTDYGQLGFPGGENLCADPPGGIGDLLSPPTAEGGALRAQDMRTPADPAALSGTVIRIDPDTGAGVPGNPFSSSLDPNARRIVAYGFRNPFRIALDPAHGDLYVANVGWGTDEEIDRVPALPAAGQAANSGWPCYEGPAPNPAYQSLGLKICSDLYAEAGSTVEPFFFYRHGVDVVPGDGCSPEPGAAVAAALVYPGGPFPDAYDGSLFFADTVRNCIWNMKAGEDGRPDASTATPFLTDAWPYPGADFAIGPEGDFYYLKFYGYSDKGSLRRIVYDPDSPRALLTADRTWGAGSIVVTLNAGGSSDPNGEALSYAWDLNGDGSFETDGGAQQTRTYKGTKNVVVSVKVEDGTGRTDVARLTLYPNDTPPDPVIETDSGDWAVGDRIEFSGYATDAEDDLSGGIGEAGLFWRTQIYHCPDACHAHPLQAFPGVGGGTLSAPDHDYPAYVKLILTATDSRGLSATEEYALYPRAVDLGVESYPPGVAIAAGTGEGVAPWKLRAIARGQITLVAPPTAVVDGAELQFLRWSNGGPRVQTVVADADRTYTAYYREPDDDGIPPKSRARPDTRLRATPTKRTFVRTARFGFGAGVAGARFECKLDARPYASCRSPRIYRHLAPGKHVLRVRATAPDGTREQAPAVYRWRVLTRPLR